MALPVWAYYMRRVYADKQLGYDPNALFDLPSGYDPCVEAVDSLDQTNGIDEIYE